MDRNIKVYTIIIITIICAFLLWNAKNSFINRVTITIELQNNKSDVCQLFYDTGNGFDEKSSIIIPYTGSDSFSFIKFDLPILKFKNIRIDPVTHSEQFLIKTIEIQVGNQLEIYSGNEVLEHFIMNLPNIDTTSSDFLSFQSSNVSDIQIRFSHQLPDVFEMENYKDRLITFGTIFSIYLLVLIFIIFFGNRMIAWIKKILKPDLLKEKADIAANLAKNYLNENRYIIFFSFLIAILSFGYELSNFTLSIDEEIDSFRSAQDSYVYIFVGRWGLYFLNQIIVPHSTMPYFPTLIALFGIVLSSILFLSTQKDNLTAKLIFAIIFISSPIHSYYLAFNTSGLYYSIGMLLTTIAYILFQKAIESKKTLYSYYVLSILFLAFSLSLYQALLSFFFVFGAFYLLFSAIQNQTINIRPILKKTITLFIMSGLAFLVYKLGDIASRYYILDPLKMEIPSYLEGFITWGKWPFLKILDHLVTYTKEYLSGVNPFLGELGLSIKTFFAILAIFIYYLIRKTNGFLNRTIILILVTIFILSPFAVMYLNGFQLPVRTFMSLPLMVAIIWLMTYRYANYWIKKILILSAFIILFNNIYTNTRLFYSAFVSWQADKNMAVRIIERIYQLDPPIINDHIQVHFVGMYKHETNELFFKSDIFGSSFFEWNPGTQYRIISFFRTLGIEELIALPKEKLKQYEDEINKMPCWPAKGSVYLIDNVTVIKLSEP